MTSLVSFAPRPPAVARSGGQPFRFGLWLPITPLFLLLAPLALAVAPLIRLSRPARRLNPWRVAWGLGAVLLSLSGTLISVDAPGAQIRIRIL